EIGLDGFQDLDPLETDGQLLRVADDLFMRGGVPDRHGGLVAEDGEELEVVPRVRFSGHLLSQPDSAVELVVDGYGNPDLEVQSGEDIIDRGAVRGGGGARGARFEDPSVPHHHGEIG